MSEINKELSDRFEGVFSSFLIGCNPVSTKSHHLTDAFKDMRRLVKGASKGPINPERYKKFSVVDVVFFSKDMFSFRLVNKSNLSLYIESSNIHYLKHWCENIKDSPTLNTRKLLNI